MVRENLRAFGGVGEDLRAPGKVGEDLMAIGEVGEDLRALGAPFVSERSGQVGLQQQTIAPFCCLNCQRAFAWVAWCILRRPRHIRRGWRGG